MRMKQSAESSELKNPAWSKQSFLKEERIPTIPEVIEIASGIEKDRDRALFVLAYLTAGRIREIVRNKEKPSIRKNDLEIKDVKGRKILLINMRNQKNKEKKRKELPVPLDIKENAIFWNLLIPHLNTLSNEEELFPITYQTAYYILDRISGWNCHWFRHIRLTHLVVEYDYGAFQLMMYAGWSDLRPAKNYLEMRWTDLLY